MSFIYYTVPWVQVPSSALLFQVKGMTTTYIVYAEFAAPWSINPSQMYTQEAHEYLYLTNI